jgi:hypothetical protein
MNKELSVKIEMEYKYEMREIRKVKDVFPSPCYGETYHPPILSSLSYYLKAII